MTNKERRRFTRLFDRLMTLRLRVAAGLCTKLDDERQEIAALEWALITLANATGFDIDLTEQRVMSPVPWPMNWLPEQFKIIGQASDQFKIAG